MSLHTLQVKLNNPLMGTETLDNQSSVAFLQLYIVKLNNPLMGTETLFLLYNSTVLFSMFLLN